MKVIGFILVIVTSVAAQKMKACAFIRANNAKINSDDIGKLRFTQSSPTQNIVISGRIKKLPPKDYVVVVHEDYNILSKSCNALGPIKEVSPAILLTLAHIKIEEPEMRRGDNSKRRYSKSTRFTKKIAEGGTLLENRPTSIVGYSIAFYDASTFKFFQEIPAISNVACGLVIEGPACE